MKIISVIVPIYKSENYIERCARSLFEQTLDGIEYIFVNDSTPDDSMRILNQIIEDYPERRSNVIIINQKYNQGVAAARKIGMEIATGEYQIHCDSDDWIDANLYEKMYVVAKDNNADIAHCGFICQGIKEYNVITFDNCTNPHDVITKKLRGGLCCRLIKSELIHKYNIYPIPGVNYGEDRMVLLKAYYYASKVVTVNGVYYHYFMDNVNSLTKKGNELRYIEEQRKCIDHISNFFKSVKFDYKFDFHDKANIRVLYLNLNPPRYRDFKNCYPECTKYVIKDKKLPILYRVCYFLANYGFFLPFKVYFWLSQIKVKVKKK